ncbi:leucine--tRNA ligase [Buchnera aphidicola (Thelaxes californica)]|uniref:Leucine--tRNA ligase n=1 Tax=Buchnera aphidicola (Thelaxes californica) TaxID=1315998 RepID=A0A4D6YCE0_9GAMM|nr:leucine--tRNA ligase [Buchnera aphidicola (Thelaxes californica)]
MYEKYNYKKIEKYVQKYWYKNKTFSVTENTKKKKYYCLAMLPYPSGNLHMGHVRNYTISDVISRCQRMLGKNVLHPIGWDAFGLPAEEAAIKNKLNPKKWTENNIIAMKKQLYKLGYSYDWNREINTSNPEYYKWEQWLFIQLYKKKLVYKKKETVYWCPIDKTVLANEQVIHGTCWRCQTEVQIKKISQWFLKITHYAKELLHDLKMLHQWPNKVVNMQKQWIGETKGIEIKFKIFNDKMTIKIFTTRIDTIMGVTFLSLSPEHPFSKKIAKKKIHIKNFLKEKIEKNVMYNHQKIYDYIGINTEYFAIHPINNNLIPIWITNYVTLEHNIKAIMSIPAHNIHDFSFALKYNINIKNVINISKKIKKESVQLPIIKKGYLHNSGDNLNTLNSDEATKIIKKILFKKKIAKEKIIYKIKDWNISRQRYWGTPIPIAVTKTGKKILIPESDLPVVLPDNDLNAQQEYINILKLNSKWKKININGEIVQRETDTFDTFMESSWYYIRYTNPHIKDKMIDQKAAQYWLPVDQYIGGIEHATMHLLYFRFFHKLLRDLNLVKTNEPVQKLTCQGMVLSNAFYYLDSYKKKHWVNLKNIKITQNKKGKKIFFYQKKKIEVINAGIIKMSKSKNNGIDPNLMIEKYGADTIRLFVMFAAPIENALEWQENGVKGMSRFLNKLWNLVIDKKKYKRNDKNFNYVSLTHQEKNILSKLHETIMKVTYDIYEKNAYNTAIASIIILVKKIEEFKIETEQSKSILFICLLNIVKMMYPFSPHICFFMWEKFLSCSTSKTIDFESWPQYDKTLILKKNIVIVQINGKKKCNILTDVNTPQNIILKKITKISKISLFLKNKKIKKIIYIKSKIFNIVTEK